MLTTTSLLCALPDSLHHWLQAAAHHYGTSPSTLILHALTRYRRALRQQGLPCTAEAIEALGTAASPFAVDYPDVPEPVVASAPEQPGAPRRKAKAKKKGTRRKR